MKKIIIIIALIIIIAAGGVGVLYATTVNSTEEISLTTLAEKIQQEQIESIVIQGDTLEVVLKDGTQLHSKKEIESSLTESLLNYGASAKELSEVNIEVKSEKFPVALKFFLPFLFIFGLIFVYYHLILTGFKILKIEEVPRSKVTIYVSIMFLLSLFLNSTISIILRNVSYKPIFYFTSVSVSFLIVFLLLKYYFLLSGKKLWQFLLYLIVVSITLSLVIKLIFVMGIV